jgi:hypothetical protein
MNNVLLEKVAILIEQATKQKDRVAADELRTFCGALQYLQDTWDSLSENSKRAINSIK